MNFKHLVQFLIESERGPNGVLYTIPEDYELKFKSDELQGTITYVDYCNGRVYVLNNEYDVLYHCDSDEEMDVQLYQLIPID